MDDLRLERSTKDVWHHVLQLLDQQLTKPFFEAWIRPVQMRCLGDGIAQLAVHNVYAKQTLTTKALDALRRSFTQVLGYEVDINFVVDETLGRSPENYTASIATITVAPSHPGQTDTRYGALDRLPSVSLSTLNPKYTIESFVVGVNNRFCHSEAMAVANNPGQTYNPLFIYSGVGLGKTHLMQAIGHHVLLNNHGVTVRYITCEKFTNDLVN